MMMLFDVPVPGGGAGAIAAVAVLFIFIAAAFIAFRLLKKTMKMAFRIAIVAIILAIGLAGSVFFYAIGTSKPSRPQRPTPTNNR